MADITFVGVDSGASQTRVFWGDEYVWFSTPPDYSDYVKALSTILARLSVIDRLVVALPTVIEAQQITAPPNLGSGWDKADLPADLRAATRMRINEVFLAQDTEAAGYGVLHGEGERTLPALLITLSSGVGGAVLSEDGVRPLEVGHMILDLSGNGYPCACKQRGCVEAELSGFGMKDNLKIDPQDAPQSFWQSYGVSLGRFLGALAPLFMTKEILLMGGVSKQGEHFLPACNDWLKSHVRRMAAPAVTTIAVPDTVGAYGAFVMAKRARRAPERT